MKRIKRIVSGALAFACAAAAAVSVPPTVSAFAASTAVTTDYLNLRTGAGTGNSVLLTLSKGATVTVLDNSNAEWAKVQTAGGKQGYCSKQYLSFSGTSSGAPFGSAPSGTATVTSNLNMRSGAGTSYSIVVTLKSGTSVKVLDSSNAEWAKVQTSDGRQGYCSKQYLKFVSTASTGSTTGSTGSTGSASAGSSAVTTDYLNLRQGAGTNYQVIVTLGKGVTVKVLDNSNAQWAKVQAGDGKQGYCSKQYLQFSGGSGSTTTPSGGTASSTPSTTPATPTTPAANLMGLTVSSVSIRSGAGTSYGVVCTLAGGTVVTVTDNSDASWVKIKTSSGQQGYCPRGQLIVSQDADFNAGSGDSDTGGSSSHTVTGATVTADVLRLRDQASTSGQVLANLPNGTSLTVLDTSNASWIKVQTSAGQVGYVSAEFVKLRYSDDSSNTSGLSLSTSSQNVPMGKTLYIKAAITPSDSAISWTSSNTAVATVSNGYVYAASKGSAVVTASSGSYHAACTVTVTDAEPVKTAYASPNIASTGVTVTLTAVTDTTRDGVQFFITSPDGSSRTVNAGSSTAETKLDTTVKIWKATTTFSAAGTYSFTAYSSANGKMSSSGYTTNAYVSAQQDFTTTTNEDRRISDQMISLIATWEGYRSTVYADQLTSNQVPTIGYGCTLGSNAIFYNNMTETEAWSMLVNKINNSSYTSELNKMIHANNFLMNQNQADCLISFAYNVGAGYFNSSTEPDFKIIMENAVVPPDFSGGASVAATVTKNTSLMGAPSTGGAQLCSVSSGTAVTVTGSSFSNTRDGWYQVTLSSGSQGWLNSGYVSLSNAASLVHDLNYTNAYAFGTELIRWNQAGGKFYAGLFYRRMGEANAYNYGDYDAVRYNKYNYSYPSGAAGLS